MATEFDFLCKILLVGGDDSGKSSLLLRFTDGIYSESVVQSDEEGTFKIKKVTLADQTLIKLQLWDVSFQDRKTITGSYFRGAQGIILVFNLFSAKSFEDLRMWVGELESDAYHTRSSKKLIIGHADNTGSGSTRVTSFEDAKAFADQAGFSYQEANARTGENVEESFQQFVEEIVLANRQGSDNNNNSDSPSPSPTSSSANAQNASNLSAPDSSSPPPHPNSQKQKSNSIDDSKKKPDGCKCIVS